MRAKSTPQSRQRKRNREVMRANFKTRHGFNHIAPMLGPVQRAPHESVESAIERASQLGQAREPWI